MFKNAVALLAVSSALLGTITGCGNRSDTPPDTGVRQTHFPGQVTADGATSGEVMERSKKVASSGAPSGTPGIPEGSEGNTGGAALGGTTSGAAATKDTRDGREPSGSTPPPGNR